MVSSSDVKSEEDVQPVEGTIGSSAVFKLPGQRYATPSPGNGDRVFYESLLEQRPDSEMAQEWCVYYGVLSSDRAAALNALIVKRKGGTKPSAAANVSPVKVKASPVKAAKASPAAKKAPAKKPAAKKGGDKKETKSKAKKDDKQEKKEKKK